MMQRKPMNRARKPKAPRPAPLVGKNLGKMLVDKGPVYSEAHLELVRAQQCMVTRSHGVVAHHARELFPRTAGKRITDFAALPLRPDMHDGHDHSLHKAGGTAAWWLQNGYTRTQIFTWIRTFLRRHYPNGHPGVTQAFEMMAAEEAKGI